MTIVVPHGGTKADAVAKIDQGIDTVIAKAPKNIELTNVKKTWNGDTLALSLTGGMGFISVPLTATAIVDDKDVTVEFELPPMVKNFLGEAKVQADVDKALRKILE